MENNEGAVGNAMMLYISRSVKITTAFVNSVMRFPEYATKGSAGFDLQANIKAPFILHRGERALISTGIKVALPFGHELQIRPRSGMVFKHGVTVLNSPGTIDSDYRGDIGVILHGSFGHSSPAWFTIEPGMRIAQAVLSEYRIAVFEEWDDLDDTERGSGGFGSTGE